MLGFAMIRAINSTVYKAPSSHGHQRHYLKRNSTSSLCSKRSSWTALDGAAKTKVVQTVYIGKDISSKGHWRKLNDRFEGLRSGICLDCVRTDRNSLVERESRYCSRVVLWQRGSTKQQWAKRREDSYTKVAIDIRPSMIQEYTIQTYIGLGEILSNRLKSSRLGYL